MDPLETLDHDGLDAKQRRPLRRPVPGRAHAVFLAAEDHERHAFAHVFLRRVIDRQLLAIRLVLGPATFDAAHHLVLDANVGKGAAHHDLMVAAARAVGVEIPLHHLVLPQVVTRRGRLFDVAGRADVIGGDVVTKQGQDPSAGDVSDRLRRHGDAVEIGRVLHIRAAAIPFVGLAGSIDLDRLPFLRALEHFGVAGDELLAADAGANGVGDLLVAGPDILQIDRLPVRPGAECRGGDILVHRAQQRVGHHQRGTGEVVGPDVRMHPAFEVAVTGEHAHRDQLVPLDRVGDRRVERAGVADARRAAVTDQLEP